MSAGVCGKRAGFDYIFGSPSPQGPSAQRSRCCSPFGSPTRCSDLGFGSEDKLSVLSRMLPSVGCEVVESILESHDNKKIDDAIKNLHALCLCNDHDTGNMSKETAPHIQHENTKNLRLE